MRGPTGFGPQVATGAPGWEMPQHRGGPEPRVLEPGHVVLAAVNFGAEIGRIHQPWATWDTYQESGAGPDRVDLVTDQGLFHPGRCTSGRDCLVEGHTHIDGLAGRAEDNGRDPCQAKF